MFLLRQAKYKDRRRLLKLARQLDSINLPTKADELDQALQCSERSFRGQIRDRAKALYIFCAEEIASGKIAGASMVIAKHGTPQSPHCYLEIDSEERYSHTLRKMFRHSYLRLRYSMDGPTEVGGLIVDPIWRGHAEKVGKQISWLRFLYIAKHLKRFEPRVIAEIMPPLSSDHGNLFWDHYGRRVTGLSFSEADRLSIHDKEFIRTLFPESPLYTFLLPEDVRASLGAIGEQSRGAVRLLEQAGLRFLNHIDPFDGGPYYGAATAELVPVKELRSLRARRAAAGTTGGALYLVGREDRGGGFRAVKTDATVEGERIAIAPEFFKLLKIKENERVDALPLP